MQVLKFGGSSLADAANMLKAADIISRAVDRDRTIVIASAIFGCTDTLIDIGNMAAARDGSYTALLDELQTRHHSIIRELLPVEKHEESLESCDSLFASLRGIAQGVYLLGELSPASLDAIQGCGELLSSRILATKMASVGISTKWVNSMDIIRTHGEAGRNVVDIETTYANVQSMIDTNPIVSLFIVPGFIASDEKGRMVTLGRGGSDYSASIYAVGSKARALETWKDVPGMMTADPKIVPQASLIRNISYRAALELSHFGAKVIYPPTIQPVVAERIPIYVKCTFDPDGEGTLSAQNPPTGNRRNKIVGTSSSDTIALLEGSGMVGVPGFSYRLFQTLSEHNISIILITQASSVNTMCVAVAEKDAALAKEAADACFAYEISLGKLNPLKVEKGYSIVCLVGDDIINQRGTTGRMLAALGRRSIGVRAVAQGSSERNISVILASEDARPAIQYIHKEFFEESKYKDINLFVAGYGTVGKALIDIIAKNKDKIAERTGKRLHLAGLSNSRKFILDKQGLKLDNIEAQLAEGKSAANDAFFEAMAKVSLQNSIFVDCTASSDISYKYLNLFERGYSVVASNKITFAAPYKQYKALKTSAVENRVSLRYETTVGAALPILESISRSVNSGDAIVSIEAVLSGTMNYIFSTYKGGEDGKTFYDVVKYAKEAGYSEPDPRLDLSGRDVLRKLLILSREAGAPIDEADVHIDPVLGLQAVGPDRPLYSLCGTDNAALIKTEFYPSPLVIQGAGAGAYQTASGTLNDILM